MRKIFISPVLEKNVTDFCIGLFTDRDASFITPLVRLKKLHDALKPLKHKKFREYVSKIINQYDEILSADPAKMIVLKTEFSKIDTGILMHQNIPYKKYKFYESIVHAMRYEDLRDKEFLKYLKTSEIKSCIYCNAQLSVVIDYHFYDKKMRKRVKKRVGKLELDHYYPKSEHPFLCTSFYNLYPCCGNCNRSKSYNPVSFELYTRSNDLDVFKFWIDDASIIKYWGANDSRELKIQFEHIVGDINILEEHNKIFGIQGIYDTQQDLAEELVHKAKAYSSAYKQNLVKNFSTLFPDQKIINRLIIGNYDEPEDIHKRPMAKYTQDIARQLKLI